MIESNDPVISSETPPDFPWPPRENIPFLDAVAMTWKESVFQPASFFRRMPREISFGAALGYYMMMGIIGAGLSLFWRMLFGASFVERLYPDAASENPFFDFLFSPIILMFALYFVAGIMHLFLMMFRGSKHGFGTTLRVCCLSEGPQLFHLVPFLGPLIAGIWTVVLYVVGLREAHETTTGKALASVLVPMFLLLSALALFIVIAMILGAAAQLPV